MGFWINIEKYPTHRDKDEKWRIFCVHSRLDDVHLQCGIIAATVLVHFYNGSLAIYYIHVFYIIMFNFIDVWYLLIRIKSGVWWLLILPIASFCYKSCRIVRMHDFDTLISLFPKLALSSKSWLSYKLQSVCYSIVCIITKLLFRSN